MNILITGGAGFLATKLCAALLMRGALTDVQGARRAIKRIRLFDVVTRQHDSSPLALPSVPPSMPRDDQAQDAQGGSGQATRVESLTGDVANPTDVQAALSDDTDSVFHLAAVVSGEAEQNFDLGMRVNVDGTRALLEACRRLPTPAKIVFTSSLAVFGGPLPEPVPDSQAVTPQNSYGAQKAIGELLINDMSRKGFVDGRCLRLPTITVRPGKPNKAASSFLSGIIREPLNGVEAICPVEPQLRAWVLSPRRAIENLLLAHELPASAFSYTRSINVPGLTVRVSEMVEVLREAAGEEVAARVKWQRDRDIQRIVASWPAAFEATFGRSLGMQADADLASIVRAYIEDDYPAGGRSRYEFNE
jgi:nucleoside-diphosphate-sugar epimerase